MCLGAARPDSSVLASEAEERPEGHNPFDGENRAGTPLMRQQRDRGARVVLKTRSTIEVARFG